MYVPNFSISPKLNNLVSQIEAVRERVDSAPILPELEIALRHRAAVESAHSSTSIEGNPLSKHQVQQAIAGKLNHWERSVIEVTNYKKAWDWVVNAAKQNEPIELEQTLLLHSIVMKDLLPKTKVGHLRPGAVYIVDVIGADEQVRYTGPDANQVQPLLNDLFSWVQQNPLGLHPVLLAGIFHYEFVSIHPFSDGNGRVTRLLVKLLLESVGYDFRGSLVLDTYYWQNQGQYYQMLNQAENYPDQRVANLDPWLEYFVTGFYEVAKELSQHIDILKHLRPSKIGIRLNPEEIRVLDYLQQFGQAKIQDVKEILELPERTAQRRLKGLLEYGLIKRLGEGKKITYVLRNF
ncbi:MAG: Fic family protein [bacterium]|nr:Fic family protein [bacterium]